MRTTLTLAALAFSSLSVVAHARSTDVPSVPTIDVFYADLNLSRPAGAEAMLSRIRSAAVQVCQGKPEPRELADMTRYRLCVSMAVRNAVAALNATMVTQLYAAKFGASHGTYVTQR